MRLSLPDGSLLRARDTILLVRGHFFGSDIVILAGAGSSTQRFLIASWLSPVHTPALLNAGCNTAQALQTSPTTVNTRGALPSV
ncbi:hypothetical protein [Xylella fastidiosa]|uniref:hypothetical protein n=1 Tax=Xylella fastidiosa TaxID=2371 RepID=UPI00249E8287|nr:hypothetical protein [Xylella fastidiosa]WGZ35616.1 hypothetical protein O4445_00130 [Xylella fastidiosa subsp. pauca]